MLCKYTLNVPVCHAHGPLILCDAYSQSKRPDGYHWANWPTCEDKNCPLKHPKLLEGAILEDKEVYT